MNHLKIQLGDKVRDAISGIEGITTVRMVEKNGNVRFGVQPKAPEGATSLPEAMFYDYHSLEVVEPGVIPRTDPVDEILKPGSVVVENAFRFEATVVSSAVHVNGCVYYTVLPNDAKKLIDLGFKAPDFFNGLILQAERLELKPEKLSLAERAKKAVGAAPRTEAKSAPVPAAAQAGPPGGPPSPVGNRMSARR